MDSKNDMASSAVDLVPTPKSKLAKGPLRTFSIGFIARATCARIESHVSMKGHHHG